MAVPSGLPFGEVVDISQLNTPALKKELTYRGVLFDANTLNNGLCRMSMHALTLQRQRRDIVS